MKAVKVFFIILGIVLVIAGVCLSLGAFSSANNPNNLSDSDSALTFVRNTYEITDDFKRISISENQSDIQLLPSEDGTCKIICEESEKVFYLIEVVAGTLYIEVVDERDWLDHVGIFLETPELLIYLPKSEYDSLGIDNVSGSITVPEGFSFSDVDINTTSGSIKFYSNANGELELYTVSGSITAENASPESFSANTTSGKIKVSSLSVQGEFIAGSVSGGMEISDCECSDITVDSTSGSVSLANVSATDSARIETVSGKISMNDCSAGSIILFSTSGAVSLENVVASGSLRAETLSGEIELIACDAESLDLASTSGSIKGTLLSEKVFSAESTSGSIDVPYCTEGGSCEISTVSGSIRFEIEPEE